MTTYFEQDKFTNCKVNGLLADEILISDNKIITLTRDISQDKDPSSTVRNLFLLKKEIGEIYAADTSRVTERQTFPIILAGTSQECREIENDIFKKENIYARDFKIIPRDEYYESKDKIILIFFISKILI